MTRGSEGSGGGSGIGDPQFNDCWDPNQQVNDLLEKQRQAAVDQVEAAGFVACARPPALPGKASKDIGDPALISSYQLPIPVRLRQEYDSPSMRIPNGTAGWVVEKTNWGSYRVKFDNGIEMGGFSEDMLEVAPSYQKPLVEEKPCRMRVVVTYDNKDGSTYDQDIIDWKLGKTDELYVDQQRMIRPIRDMKSGRPTGHTDLGEQTITLKHVYPPKTYPRK